MTGMLKPFRKGSTLKGSSLIEAITASVIFIIVFCLSMELMANNELSGNNEEFVFIEADQCINDCLAVYSEGNHLPGEYRHDYHWGTVTVKVECYDGYEDLLLITINADIRNRQRKMQLRHIVERRIW